MTPEQVQLIKLSFTQVMAKRDQVGRLFYDRLFTIAPEVRPLFKGDVQAQSRKLMDTMALAIGMLRDTPTLTSTLKGLAKRHVAYGVRDEHYDKVGEALLWTLAEGLGSAFTPQARAAWAALYTTIKQIMLDATREAPQAAPLASVG
jgi:hemoglobin-like flavoprotein